MEKPDIKGLWSRLGRSRLAARVAEDLGGDKAQAELLRLAGYSRQPQGLASRMAADLVALLPLRLTPESLRAFGRGFPGPALLEAARREAEADLAGPAGPGAKSPLPASQLRLSPEEEAAWLPWTSGQRFLRLARAYAVSGDGDLAEAAWAQLERFCLANPPLLGPGWASGALLAIRAANWLWGMRFLATPAGLAGLDAARGPLPLALLHLRLTGLVLAQELDAGRAEASTAAVEPVAAASALLHLGRCLPCLPEAGAWWEAGRLGLGEALAAWTRPGQTEGARPWAEAVAAAEWGGLGLWLGSAAGAQMPGVVEGVRRLAGLGRSLAPPWGGGSLWGWSTHAPVLGLDPRPEKAAGGAANLAACLLSAPELRAGRELDERLYWTLGPEAGEKLRQLAGGPVPGAGDWPGAGLVGLCASGAGRKAGIHLNASASPALALALDLHLEGRPLLAPPGPAGKGPLGPYLAGRSAHNAVLIDRREPSPGGRVVLEALEQGPRHLFLAASYDGYAGLKDPVHLRRRVFLDLESGLVNLVDQVQAEGQHVCEVLFHLPPETRVEPAGQGSFMLSGPFGQALFKPEPKAKVTLVTGRSNPPLGWQALDLGRVVPAPVLRLRAAVVGNVRLTNVIAFTSGREV